MTYKYNIFFFSRTLIEKDNDQKQMALRTINRLFMD